jgi:hypothetical protein
MGLITSFAVRARTHGKRNSENGMFPICRMQNFFDRVHGGSCFHNGDRTISRNKPFPVRIPRTYEKRITAKQAVLCS